MASLKQYLSAVEKKLNDPAVKKLLQFGQTFNTKVTPLRDAVGMDLTRQSIMQTAENAYNILDGKVAMANMFRNFSAGYSDVAKVETVGAIDLTILAMAQSLVPFVCVDRGLATPTATIYFNNIVSASVDGVGGVNGGDTVSGNFMPPNVDVDLGSTKSGIPNEKATIELGTTKIIPGEVKVTVIAKDKDGKEVTFEGRDFQKDENIYFANGCPVTATVTYETGAVEIKDIEKAVSVFAEAKIDNTKDATGSGVLTVIPEWTPVTLETQPLNIVLQNNIANMMFMQKTYTTATGSTTSPYNDVLFQRVKNTYIEAVNVLILKKLIRSAKTELIMDLSNYSVQTSFSNTKNDAVCQLISNMKAALLGKTGCPLTALIVNSNAAAIIEQIPIQFVANPMINLGLNGLIGYFNGIPVFRHNALDNNIAGLNPGIDGILYGVYRNTDNTSGSQVFGEFIPFTSTGNVSNFNMPVQNSTGYFSQVGSEVISDNLVVKGVIQLGETNKAFAKFSQE